MLDQLAQRLGVSTTVAALILALFIVQLSLQLYALVDLMRRDAVRGGKKWVWLLVIAFGNLLGALVYLIAGTRPERIIPGGASTASSDAARRAVDALYGPRNDQ
jgi:hypothetical protein